MRYPVYSVIAGLALTGPLLAGNVLADEPFRQYGAHTHGVGQLNVVLDGSELLIELHNPGANMVGFEHAPTTPEQTQAVADAIAYLEDPARVFGLPAEAACELVAVTVANVMPDEDHDHEDDHDHDYDHDHDHEDSHDHVDGHSEFQADYAFRCAQAEQLDSIEVKLFQDYPASESLQAQVAGPGSQAAVELTAANPRLSL